MDILYKIYLFIMTLAAGVCSGLLLYQIKKTINLIIEYINSKK